MNNGRFLIVAGGVVVALASALPGEEGLIRKDGKWVKAPAPAEGSPAGELALIRQHIEQRRETKAVDAVKKFLQRYPDEPGCEEALMLAGQAEMNREHYYQAFEWFEQQLSRFPNGELYERALHREYEIGDAFLKGRKRLVMGFVYVPAQQDGLDILSRLAEHAPGAAVAEKALLRIGEHHVFEKEFAEAVQAYDHCLSLFPKSQNAPYAMLRGARALYASYRGPEFDETPLLDAEQRFKEFAQRYPMTAGRENVPEMLKIIHAARGQRLYEAGRLYERTKHPEAAAHYYKLVMQDYPNTDWAARARGDLARLGAKTVQAGDVIPQPATKPVEGVPSPKSEAPAPTTQEGGVRK